jgi:hypothetical protein
MENRNLFWNWFPALEKMIKDNRVPEIIGKNSHKTVKKLGMKECGVEWILEHKNFGIEFIDFKGF